MTRKQVFFLPLSPYSFSSANCPLSSNHSYSFSFAFLNKSPSKLFRSFISSVCFGFLKKNWRNLAKTSPYFLLPDDWPLLASLRSQEFIYITSIYCDLQTFSFKFRCFSFNQLSYLVDILKNKSHSKVLILKTSFLN